MIEIFKKYKQPLLWVLTFQVISMVIGFATQGDIAGWYQTLQRPRLTPPNFIFPIMWTLLYALIALAAWRVWVMPKSFDRSRLGYIFIVYILMNWSWTFIFFSLHELFLALQWILIMNAVALYFIAHAWDVNKKAAWLMIPPTLWTLFASYLTFGNWFLN